MEFKRTCLIDLKIGKLKHQDIGQMQMYVNYYDREMKLDDENKTIGIVLCQQKINLWWNTHYQKIMRGFLQVHIRQFCQVKKN